MQVELGPYRLAAVWVCVRTPGTAQQSHDGQAPAARVEHARSDVDGPRPGAVLDGEQQRVLARLEGHLEGRLRMQHGVGGELAHDEGPRKCASTQSTGHRWAA